MQPIDMNGARRCGSRRSTEMADDGGNGYVETDPTGRYGRFDELLGRGSMKSVYKAFDEVRGVEVAWNQANLSDVLRTPDALHRIYAEVHLLAALRHDAIISFHASWVNTSSKKQTFNFVTELFSSGTLRAYRLRHRRVSHRAVRSWARQLLRGLAYLHSRDPPVIHRDLKCDNVFVNGHLGQLKIGDLGLAAVGARAGSVVGTPEFMAPEMYDEDYDELVDVYSFGMCVLEMLTAEYPYAECSNPAQIYKKVTAGKLPDAFHRLDDAEARRFIGRCLVAAAQRPSAEELLLDPFLDDHAYSTAPPLPSPCAAAPEARKTGMTITGKLNADDDSIFLKVQLIADESAGGRARNIYFPFDIVGDTAMEVAKEMVKELEIEDREPSEIAAMIEQEIARLVPGWRGNAGDDDGDQHEYTYDDDEHPPPFYYLSSSPSSSQGSHCGVGPSTSGGFPGPHGSGWSKDFCYYPTSDDDDVSSVHSSGSAQPTEGPNNSKAKATRFGPEDGPTHQLDHQQRAGRPRQRACLPDDGDEEGQRRRRMNMMRRNRSMVDMRSQLLHRSLVDELNKRLFFNTVGTVQDIGFRDPTADDRRRRRATAKDGKQKNIF